jgi:hypothetical protein
MSQVKPRFEFRTFAQSFGLVEEKMRRLSPCGQIRESAEIIRPNTDLVPVHVSKRRFGFTVNDCITEYAELLINGAAIKTVAVESVNVDDILKAKEMLGLNEYENVNYLLAIKRIVGREPLPA